MKSKPPYPSVHVCDCPACQQGERSEIVEEHRAINQLLATLDEKWRRVFAGFWATVYGRGGIERLAVVTALSRTTIRRGKREFQQPGDSTRLASASRAAVANGSKKNIPTS